MQWPIVQEKSQQFFNHFHTYMCWRRWKSGRNSIWADLYLTTAWILSIMENIAMVISEVLAVEKEKTSFATAAFVSFRNPWMGILTPPVPAVKLKYSSFLYHCAWLANWHGMVALWWQSLSGHGHHTHDELEALGLSRSQEGSGLWKAEILKNCSPLMKISSFQQPTIQHKTVIKTNEIQSFNNYFLLILFSLCFWSLPYIRCSGYQAFFSGRLQQILSFLWKLGFYCTDMTRPVIGEEPPSHTCTFSETKN